MLRSWVFGLTLLLLANTGAIANAVTWQLSNPQILAQGKMYAGEPDDTEHLLERLNATPEQKQKMQKIHAQYKDRISQHKQLVRQAQQQLQQLLSSSASQSEIRQQYDELLRLKQEMSKLQFEIILEVREVLSPEQRRQFADIMEQRRRNRPR
ncbi:Spy/CpxP family protein refolding chaperone [Capilliphycus salinus ALCB114379]|uniref:Spy/CpxP family protein refolding chaperone n=1 Tax=Capilliphycus salinus TaxID=2768948 RepID=UPI0039A52E9F